MNYNNFKYVHMYGIEIGEYNFSKEFDEIDTDYGKGDQYGILDKLLHGNKAELHEGIPYTGGMNLVAGHGFVDYIGYGILMPYEQRIMTKEQMDKNLRNLSIYLYGEDIAKKIRPKEIFEVWS